MRNVSDIYSILPLTLNSPGDPRLTPEVKLALNPRPLPETSVKNRTVIRLVVENKSEEGPMPPVRTAGEVTSILIPEAERSSVHTYSL